MRIVIQRVNEACVKVDDSVVGKINKGLLVFLGVSTSDTKDDVDFYINKILKLRIFADAQGKTNLSVKDVNGEILVVSQFTLYANCKKGNRPSFTEAGNPQVANELYEYFKKRAEEELGAVRVRSGIFGADMKVSLINDGPFTIVLNSDEQDIK